MHNIHYPSLFRLNRINKLNGFDEFASICNGDFSCNVTENVAYVINMRIYSIIILKGYRKNINIFCFSTLSMIESSGGDN